MQALSQLSYTPAAKEGRIIEIDIELVKPVVTIYREFLNCPVVIHILDNMVIPSKGNRREAWNTSRGKSLFEKMLSDEELTDKDRETADLLKQLAKLRERLARRSWGMRVFTCCSPA